MMIWKAELVTSHFTFESFGTSREHAMEVMERTWAEHVRQTTAELTWDELRDDVNAWQVQVGEGFRDGYIIAFA